MTDTSSMPAAPAVTDVQSRMLGLLQRLPAFSPIVRQLLASLSVDQDNVSLVAIGKLIEQDPLIAGKVLSVANSALYNRGLNVISIQQAATRLGLSRLRNVILSLSVNRIWGSFRPPISFSMARFNLHSLATATAAEILSRQICPDLTDHAFVAGLFHDVGELLLVHCYPGEYTGLLEKAALSGDQCENRERALFGITHGEVSAKVTAYWRLPWSIQTAVRFHECPGNVDAGEAEFSLCDIVYAADRYADAFGYSLSDHAYPDDQIVEMLAPFGIDDDQIRPAFAQEFSILRAA